MPEFHDVNPSYPVVQSPSTRLRQGSADDMDVEQRFHRALGFGNENGGEEDDDLNALAERIARIRRPQALKRHETA